MDLTRHNNDRVIIMQGTSRIILSTAEIPQFLDAIEELIFGS